MSDPLVIRNAILCDDRGVRPGAADILVEGRVIAAVAPAGTALAAYPGRSLDADGGVVTPGLINAHVHSHELFMRGRVWGSPLEPYILRISPRPAGEEVPTPEDAYLRTLAACVEMMEGGITFAVDDVIHAAFEDEHVDAVLQAYQDAGMRAAVSILTEDVGWLDSIPFTREFVPADFNDLANSGAAKALDRDRQLNLYRRCIDRWASRSDRVSVMVSPSAPQRARSDFLTALWAIAEEADRPFHIHVQETLSQAVSGPYLYGHSMVAELDRLGLLAPRTIVAHGVWLSDGDIAALARAGATVVHNPASNLKLGSGVARVNDLLAAGVNVALGCDGYTCNDAQDMLEAMKLSSLLSSIASPDPEDWVGPSTALRLATTNGARALRRVDLGLIDVGMTADLVIFDALSPAFLPLTDPIGQLVYSAKPGNVRTVVIDGKVVVDDGRHVHVDMTALRGSLTAASERFWASATRSLEENERLRPAFEAAYWKAERDLAGLDMYRLIPDGKRWTGQRIRDS